MTQDQAFERLGAAIYAAVFNSELVNEAIAAFEGTGVRVSTLSLEAHLGLEVEHAAAPTQPSSDVEQFFEEHRHQIRAAISDRDATIPAPVVDPLKFDTEFLRRMHIALDSPPERNSA